MQRKIALLALGALVALVIPASAMAAIYPAEHKFEIAATTAESRPTLGTSLGKCQISKISGTIPKAPGNEAPFEIPAPTVGTCTAGTTLTLSGKWQAVTGTYWFNLAATGTDAVVLRFSSLPGCKLTSNAGTILGGVWSNGTTTPSFLKSGYHAHGTRGFTWANDGGTCALAGQTEAVSYSQETGISPTLSPAVAPATDLTSPSTVLVVR
jgi:hypothetical protein